MQADGKLVAAGTTYDATGAVSDFALARYEGDSAPQGNPPTADAGGPYAIREGDSLSLDAAASGDPDGDPLTYSWDINGDGRFGDAVGVQPTLTWAQLQALGITDSGSYSVKVRVNDGHGHTVTSSAVALNIANTAPTATLTNDGPVLVGDPVTVSFTGSFDPSAADTAAGLHYAFATSEAALAGATYANSGTATSASFTFAAAGSHTVYGRVLDKDGGYNDYTTTVVVTNQPPAVVQTVVNGGQAQRSNVESIAVVFSSQTNLARLIADGEITRAARIVGPSGEVALAAARYAYDASTRTLAIDLTIDGFGGSARTMLGDGRYQLLLDASLITAPGDPAAKLVDNDGTADGVVESDFFRLLGDLNGDAQINASDLVLERNMVLGFGGATPSIAGDIDGDGDEDLADYVALRRRVGIKLPPP